MSTEFPKPQVYDSSKFSNTRAGDVLHYIDFHQLQIENKQYQTRIEERNEELRYSAFLKRVQTKNKNETSKLRAHFPTRSKRRRKKKKKRLRLKMTTGKTVQTLNSLKQKLNAILSDSARLSVQRQYRFGIFPLNFESG